MAPRDDDRGFPNIPDVPPRADQTAQLEQAFITEFLERRGVTRTTLHELPGDEQHALLREASAYASARLAEVESRAQYVHDLHHNE
jgi:hypothetical protein